MYFFNFYQIFPQNFDFRKIQSQFFLISLQKLCFQFMMRKIELSIIQNFLQFFLSFRPVILQNLMNVKIVYNNITLILKKMIKEDNLKTVQQSPSKTEVQDLESSNPFRIQIKEIGLSNPFEMKFGENKSGQLFADRHDSKGEDFFARITREHRKQFTSKQFLEEPKMMKTQSKYQSTHLEQNNKKYKDVLRMFYNRKYWERVKNSEEFRKKFKKDGSSGAFFSQEARKPQACFKASRLAFSKQTKSKPSPYQKTEDFYLVNYCKKKSQIVIFQLKDRKIKSLKPLIVKIHPQQKISPSVEYEGTYGRLFLFSNLRQQIVIVSTKSQQSICRVKLKHERTNPLLHINKFKSNLYLMVIGGYRILNDSIVEGCKYIEIFSIDKWEISLKQVILRLGIGRICPIVFSANEQSIFIIGGSSNASLNKKKQIVFNVDEDINFSTNQTGVKIESSFIEDCFSTDQSNALLINNVNVRFQNPLGLYGGTVLYRKLPRSEKLELFLSNKKQIYAIKTLKNDIHIIESELLMQKQLLSEDTTLNKSIGYHRDQNNLSHLCQVDSDGKLTHVVVSINQKNTKIKETLPECRLI